LEVVGDVDDVATLPACFFGATLLPMVMYLRIFYMRFGPMPLIARKSSLKAPSICCIFRILPAIEGPIPGTCCSSRRSRIQIHGTQRRLLGGGKHGPATKRNASTHRPIAQDDEVKLWSSRMRGDNNRRTYLMQQQRGAKRRCCCG